MAKRGGNNLNIVLGVDINALKKGFDDAVKVTQKSGGDVEKAAKAVSEGVVNSFKKIENSTSLKAASRQMFNLAASLQAGGSATEQVFRQAIREAGHLKDEIDDLNALIQVGGPAGPFIAMNNAMKVGVAGVNAIQGSMALLGGESEALMQTMVKLQAGMALAGALKELEGMKDVWTQLNFVMKQNPLFMGLAAVTAVVAIFAAFNKEIDFGNQRLKIHNQLLTEGKNAAAKEVSEVNALVAILKNENLERATRQAALTKLQQLYPDYLNNISVETANTTAAKKAIDELTASIVKRASVQAALNKLNALGEDQFQIDVMRQDLEKFKNETTDFGAFGAGGFEKAVRGRQALIDAAQKKLDEQTRAVTDFIKNQNEKIVESIINPQGAAAPKAKSAPKPSDSWQFKWSYAKVGPQLSRPDKFFINPLGGMVVPDALPQGIERTAIAYDKLGKSLGKVNIAMRQFKPSDMKMLEDAFTQISQKYAESATVFAAVSLGDIMAGAIMGTGGGIQQALSGLSNMLGSYLAELGQQLIALSGVFAGIQVALRGLDPTGMFIAGVGLLAVSGLIKGITTRANEKASARTGVRAFADGGIIFGPTLGLMGEYAGAAANPEIVAPLDRLKSLLQPSMGGFVAETRISGRDLQILLSKTERDYSRG